MEITLYKNFSKQLNSTKQPDNTITKSIREVSMKSDTSRATPTFLITGVDFDYNYIKWANRYYFINDITIGNNNIYYVSCTLDVMATWKTQILNSTQYVLRSSSNYDGFIEDNAYIAKSNKEFTTTELSNNNSRFKRPGYSAPNAVIMGIIGKGADSSTMGAVTYYIMSIDVCREIMNLLMSDNPTYLDISSSTLEVGLQKALINPIQYIVSCELIPWDYSEWFDIFHDNVVNTIPVGWWNIPISQAIKLTLSVLQSEHIAWSKQISLPTHPNYSDRGGYLNYNNWSHHSLYIEPYGSIPIDRSALKNNEIKITERVDLISGIGTITVDNEPKTGHNGEKSVYKNAKITIPIQLSQSGVDKIAQAQINNQIAQNDFNQDMGVFNSLFGGSVGVASSLSKGNTSGAITSGISGLTRAYSSIQNAKFNKQSLLLDARRASFPTTEKSGVNGALMAWYVKPLLLSSFDVPVDDDIVHLGRPLCQSVQLSTLSGYTQTRESSLNLPTTIDEVETIKGIMNGGFYIE